MVKTNSPRLYILAGCNGAGKSTLASHLLPFQLQNIPLINADDIARQLCPENVERAAFKACRIMLEQIQDAFDKKQDFAFETTLAAKSYVSLIRDAKVLGYSVSLFFLWLPSPEDAIKRVQLRVSFGGHNIPEELVRRRYSRGISNLFKLYLPLCDAYFLFESSRFKLHRIAGKELDSSLFIANRRKFEHIKNLVSEPKIVYGNAFEKLIMEGIELHARLLLEETIRANSCLLMLDDEGVFREFYSPELLEIYEKKYGTFPEPADS